ncbi:hypothetical protein [Actinomadura violacea]|uniref:Vegetative cell wall protein gp1 n=1 Tax=Actinomadura violacea TaxID=2819934 RepID=A0ABS3RPI9_9ACTN|nr:hypothetical protein [Actinomadura violacea]MBO2458463.1 hypothetical protein [Actinomadura violacea]
MNGLLGELGKRIAERWLTLLVLPGALYLAACFVAALLGHGHALDAGRLTAGITARAASPAVRSAGGQAVLLAAVLAGAAVAGLAAQALGVLVERLVLAAGWRGWPGPLGLAAGRLAERRRSRWTAAHADWHAEYLRARAPDPALRPDPRARHRAARRRDRVAVESPDRPTWSGDRVHAVALRMDREHHLDLAAVWPHLWLTVPDHVRAEVTAARTAVSRAATLGAWAVLYAPLAGWWWPAAPLAAVVALAARHRFRTAVDAYAVLLEAVTRLYAGGLATQLGIEHAGPLDAELGHALTRRLRPRLPRPE